MTKLVLILASILAFFGLFIFGPFYDNLSIQIALFALVTLWSALKTGLSSTTALLKSASVFVLSLFLFGLIFQLLKLQGRTDWMVDTALKCLIFPSSLLFLRTALAYITYLDILSWPVSMDTRFYLITYKSIFDKGGHALDRFGWYLDSYPYLAEGPKVKRLLARYASLILSLYLYLYEETENARLLLINRHKHLSDQDESGGTP